MYTVKLNLEYKCFPLWIYDKEGDLKDNYVTEEISISNDLLNQLNSIQEEFDELFIDDGIEFRVISIRDEYKKAMFGMKVQNAFERLKKELGDNFIFINAIDVNKM